MLFAVVLLVMVVIVKGVVLLVCGEGRGALPPSTAMLTFSRTIRYDAKSGAEYRMTRIGVTNSRVEAFAHAVDYVAGFK